MKTREIIIKYLIEDIDNVVHELEELRNSITMQEIEGARTLELSKISDALGKVSVLINSL